MAVNYVCDRCGKHVVNEKLYRMVKFGPGSLTLNEILSNKSKLDLCQWCVDSIMKDANEMLPRLSE